MKHLSHELRKCEAKLAYLLRSEEPKPVRKYSGILSDQPGRTFRPGMHPVATNLPQTVLNRWVFEGLHG